MLTASRDMFLWENCFLGLATLWINAQWRVLLQYDCFTNLIGVNATCWAFSLWICSRIQGAIFRRINLEAASCNGVLLLFLLTVNSTVPMRYQLHLTCTKDDHLNMWICKIKTVILLCFYLLTVEHWRWLFRKRLFILLLYTN